MNRLVARLILSHLLVVLVGAAVTYLVVRQAAPALFDESLRMGARMGMGQNGVDPEASGLLRQQVGDAVNQSLVIGLLAGVLLAAGLGTLASARLLRPIVAIRQAARRLATGHYDAAVPVPEEREARRGSPRTSTRSPAPWRAPSSAGSGCSARSPTRCARP